MGENAVVARASVPSGVSRRRRALAVVLLTALVAAACTSDDASVKRGTGRATGPPIVVGMINQENSPVGSFPEVREGAEAAVRYLNEELGGVGGRPIQLEPCATTGSPASSQACATRVLEKKPVAVIGGIDLGAASSLRILAEAAMPYVGGSPTLVHELTGRTSFMLAGGTPADVLGLVTYITDTLKVKSVGVVYLDLGVLVSALTQAARQVLRKKGVTRVKLVAERADAVDLTPALTAANSIRPDAIIVLLPAEGCARVMQAKQALGVKARMFYPSACADQGVVDAAGPGADGAYFAAGYLPYSDADENVATYRAKVAAANHEPSLLSETGFSVVMDLAALMAEADEPLTPATLTKRLSSASDHPSFLGHDFTCDRHQVPLAPAVCNTYVRILQQRGGRFRDVVGDWVTGQKLIDLLRD